MKGFFSDNFGKNLDVFWIMMSKIKMKQTSEERKYVEKELSLLIETILKLEKELAMVIKEKK